MSSQDHFAAEQLAAFNKTFEFYNSWDTLTDEMKETFLRRRERDVVMGLLR